MLILSLLLSFLIDFKSTTATAATEGDSASGLEVVILNSPRGRNFIIKNKIKKINNSQYLVFPGLETFLGFCLGCAEGWWVFLFFICFTGEHFEQRDRD